MRDAERPPDRGELGGLWCGWWLPAKRVVLVLVDAGGLSVLLASKDAAVLAGEAAVVLGAHDVLFVIDTGLLALEVGGFARGELAGADALGDAVLLVDFALVDGGAGGRLGDSGGRNKDECCREGKTCKFHEGNSFVLSVGFDQACRRLRSVRTQCAGACCGRLRKYISLDFRDFRPEFGYGAGFQEEQFPSLAQDFRSDGLVAPAES